jgi:hypothetical protein
MPVTVLSIESFLERMIKQIVVALSDSREKTELLQSEKQTRISELLGE